MTTHRLVAPPGFGPTTIELSGGRQIQLPPQGVVDISDVLEFAGDAAIEGVEPPPVKVELAQHIAELMRLGFQHVPVEHQSAYRPPLRRRSVFRYRPLPPLVVVVRQLARCSRGCSMRLEADE